MEVIHRRVEEQLRESLTYFRAVVLHGARQTGKTTLARAVADDLDGSYVTLDDTDQREAADDDPQSFLKELKTPVVIDEIQRVGDRLVLAVKVLVDTDQRPGRALLTGSTNFLTVPTISESLAGRVDIVTLWPFSMSEIEGTAGDFIHRLFDDPDGLRRARRKAPEREEYFEIVCRGGFPEAFRLPPTARRRWFTRYVRTVVDREIRAAGDIRRADVLRRMVPFFAARTAQEHVPAQVAKLLQIDRTTVDTYRAWLQTAFLVDLVPAWSRNLVSKVIKRPKLHVVDTGLAAAFLGKDAAALRRPTEPMTGGLLETLVANELRKQLEWTELPVFLHHYREDRGAEIDLVLETADGRVCGIEVKTASSARATDARGLATLRDRLDRVGNDFVQGVVLHTGSLRYRLGDRIVALPIADVWS